MVSYRARVPNPAPSNATPPTRVALAIETTQRSGGVALQDATGRRRAVQFPEARRQDDRLMPAIAALFADAGLKPADLDVLCVSTGPGGFSGLRIAVATARTLALTTGAHLVGIPSAEVVAAGTPGLPDSGRILVALASKGERAWLETLRRTRADDPWTRDPAAAARRTADEVDWSGSDALVADEHAPERMRTAMHAAGRPIITPTFDPEACLLVGLDRLLRHGPTPPNELLPIYPGPPEAVVLWNERHRAP